MIETQELISKSQRFKKREIAEASSVLFDAFYFNQAQNGATDNLEKQITFIEDFISFLNRVLTSGSLQTTEQRITLMKTIAKLTCQKEDLEILAGKYTMEDLRVAAERFGKKAQSAVPESYVAAI